MATCIDPALQGLLRRMRQIDPIGWIDDVADAVRDVGGIDACEILSHSAARAGSGCDWDDVSADREANDGGDGGQMVPTEAANGEGVCAGCGLNHQAGSCAGVITPWPSGPLSRQCPA